MRHAAQAPGKVILFGEHAINRGQPAIATSVELYATCVVEDAVDYMFQAGTHLTRCSREEVREIGRQVDAWRKTENLERIRAMARADFFAPQKYLLAKAFAESLPPGLHFSWESQVPASSGLGSGGSAFTAMVAALLPWFSSEPSLLQRAEWAQLGDVVAHGGVASGLDTQTSLLGGVIRFTGQGLAERIPCAAGACLVVANSGIVAATSEVNTRVRLWLAEKPDARLKHFHSVGAITRAAESALAEGNWDQVGRLMNLNQLVLEKIGVSRPEIDTLIEAALGAGAYGAKISGSGGGGIIIALVPHQKKDLVVSALKRAGGATLLPAMAVPGASELLAQPEVALT